MFIDKETTLRVNIYAPYKGFSSLTTQEIRERAGVIEIPDPATPADYTEDTYYRTEQDVAPYEIYTKKSPEQIAEIEMAKEKAQRADAVSKIIVTISSGKSFDGYEDAQNRIARAAVAMNDTDTTEWVLADNQIAVVTKVELVEALKLAGLETTRLWKMPYM